MLTIACANSEKSQFQSQKKLITNAIPVLFENGPFPPKPIFTLSNSRDTPSVETRKQASPSRVHVAPVENCTRSSSNSLSTSINLKTEVSSAPVDRWTENSSEFSNSSSDGIHALKNKLQALRVKYSKLKKECDKQKETIASLKEKLRECSGLCEKLNQLSIVQKQFIFSQFHQCNPKGNRWPPVVKYLAI